MLKHALDTTYYLPMVKNQSIVKDTSISCNGVTSLNANTLKIIAIAIMLLDHFVVVFFPHSILLRFFLRVPGRVVAPVICFLIAEGYYHTSNRKKYVLRLLALAAISHYPFILCFDYSIFPATSVIWALAMGLIALTALKSKKIHLVLKLIVLAACCAAAYTANWNFVAVLWIVAFGLFHGNFKRQIIAFCMIGIVFHLLPVCLRFILSRVAYLHWYHIGIFLAIPLLALYNGKLGKKSKAMSWSFYVFYPAHMVLLYLLNKYTPLAEMLGGLF